jgi:ribosomal protein S18 acetylase RimI-like enzyme
MRRLDRSDSGGSGDSARMRVVPWRGGSGSGLVTRSPEAAAPSADEIRRLCEDAHCDGFTELMTTALSAAECGPYRSAGFETAVSLVLLVREVSPHRHDLGTDRAPAASIRSGTDVDWPAIVQVDAAAFDAFWHLDRAGIEHALAATESSILRVAIDDEDEPVGYTVTGINGGHAFVQRVAIDPRVQGRGVGGACLDDAIDWARRHGVRRIMVNTEHHNTTALALYRSRGFERQRAGLVVMRVRL